MLLAIDVGNTHTVIGVFAGDQLRADWRLSSAAHRTADELWLLLKNFCAARDIDPQTLDAVGISSVVPDLTEAFETLSRKYLSLQPLTIHGGLPLGIRIFYHDPSAVGADRICNAVAGFARHGGPLIIIDFGTATTFDVIDGEGNYLGGAIALGLESAAGELHRRAAKLPKVELHAPAHAIGRDTASSMQSGLLFGAVDAAEGMVRRIRKELGIPAKAIATGGLAAIVAEHTDAIDAVEPALVLEGIRLICERLS